MTDIKHLKSIASQIRRDIIRMVHAAQSGHPGGSLGCTELFTALYFDVLDHDPKNFDMDGINQDVFILSNGHISPVYYSALAHSGYFPTDELNTFRKIDSRLQGHPSTMDGSPGVRIAAGSLGQGLSVAIGIALAKKLNGDQKLVYCLTGDGELNEGQIWEAATYIGSKKVDNLITIVDYNKKQIDGPTDEVMPLGDLNAKFKAFGFTVLEMDGNKMEDVLSVLSEAKQMSQKGQPIIILMHTEMGMGVDFMMGTHKWHGVAPNDEQTKNALEQIEETIGDY